MTPLTHLRYILAQLRSLDVHFHRHRLASLSDISALRPLTGTIPSAIILCVGLGALTLGGVEDQTVFPTRGQVIKLKAPWVRSGFTRQVGSLDGGEGGERTYVIPRFDGEVIVGGTREIGDWHPNPRPDTAKDIYRRVLEICPELEGAQQLQHLVGFRPSRKDGVRLEKGEDVSVHGSTVRVYYNYGHGGAGWQSCYGCAEDLRDLVEADWPTAKL